MNLDAMRDIDIRTADLATLVDIRNVKVNKSLPQRERLIDYIDQTRNPYLVKYKKLILKNSFGKTEATLEDRLEILALSP